MEEVLSELLTTIRSSRIAPDQINLPPFRPDVDDATSWLQQADATKVEFSWSDLQILGRIGSFLTGESKLWFDNWVPPPTTRNWTTFKQDFLESFPPKKILGRLLHEASACRSSDFNTYTAYVRQKVTLLRNLRVTWKDTDLIEIVIHGIDESNVQETASLRDFQSVADLIVHFESVPKPAKRLSSSTSVYTPVTKRPCPDEMQKKKRSCFNCGRTGHLQNQCRQLFRSLNDRGRKFPSASSSTSSKTTPPKYDRDDAGFTSKKCAFCLKPGHLESDCFTKKSIDERRRHVNLASSGKTTTPTIVKINGENYLGLIDTGADISLMSNKFLEKFRDKLELSHITIAGITSGNIVSSYRFNADVEITGQRANLAFFIVPDAKLDYDVIVGCDLFKNNQLAAVINSAGTRVVQKQLPGVMRVTDESNFNILNVPNEHLSSVRRLLDCFPEMLATGFAIPAAQCAPMEINLVDNFIVTRRPYRLSESERMEVRKIIDELLSHGIIRTSTSPFASPILLVKKKQGSYRMCVDFRELNAHTVKDKYPMPRIDDQLDRLGRGKFFTSLDLASGFHQIPIHDNSIHKTGFVTPEGHFEYLRMPFGLANAPAVFQRAINAALGDLKYTMALVYMDDILIPSETVEQGLDYLKQVLDVLRVAGFSLNLSKCKFLQTELEYLGRHISSEGIRPSKSKVEALTKVASPTDVKQVRQFMGLAGYFRKFIPNFACRTACITNLTKSGVLFQWTAEHERAKEYVINCLVSEPLLTIFNPDLPTELHTDASSVGYGGILIQKYDGQNRVVAYFIK